MTDWTSRYCASLTELDRFRDLVDSVLALAAHRRPETDPQDTQMRIDAVAHRIRGLIPHLAGRGNLEEPRSVDGLLAHLDDAVFVEHGLGRVEEVSLHPDAMDLELVLSGVPGLPVTNALIYCSIAERVGLDVFGIEVPGAFLVGIRDRRFKRLTVLDPSQNGRQLDGSEFQQLAMQIDETLDPRDFLSPASPATWLRRFLNDLAITSGRSGEIHLLDSWARLSTVTEDILG
ncbi:MAG: hypothetical protein CMJ34_05595 [Phycisphaerae bacterium]|jgi:regulator of sirC expression with transglutaminase-like and TPR domain|nr:hypothetical protein [Phycisphaerae bacterium]